MMKITVNHLVQRIRKRNSKRSERESVNSLYTNRISEIQVNYCHGFQDPKKTV